MKPIHTAAHTSALSLVLILYPSCPLPVSLPPALTRTASSLSSISSLPSPTSLAEPFPFFPSSHRSPPPFIATTGPTRLSRRPCRVMRTAFYFCGMPLRRSPRKRRSPSPPPHKSPLPPPLPLAAPSLSPVSNQSDAQLDTPPKLVHSLSLSRFAEDVDSTGAGFSDVDLSAVDFENLPVAWDAGFDVSIEEEDDYPDHHKRDVNNLGALHSTNLLGPPAITSKSAEYHPEFERVDEAVRRCPAPDPCFTTDHTPFRVGPDVERQWHADARIHNQLFGANFRTTEPDIRFYARQYQDRRKATM